MSFYKELDNLNLEELIEKFKGPPKDGRKYAVLYYQEVAQLIREKGLPGINFLLDYINKATVSRLRGIIFALSDPNLRYTAIKDLLISFLHDPRPMIVADA